MLTSCQRILPPPQTQKVQTLYFPLDCNQTINIKIIVIDCFVSTISRKSTVVFVLPLIVLPVFFFAFSHIQLLHLFLPLTNTVYRLGPSLRRFLRYRQRFFLFTLGMYSEVTFKVCYSPPCSSGLAFTFSKIHLISTLLNQ
jgi:hypothetical protein